MGGNLRRGGGRSPQKFEVGTAHASVPPIFGEVVSLEAWQSTNKLKNGVKEEIYL